ncbi:MAG: IS701 family transposase [Candidatus Electrothrix sp. EH2]|nr:IS701 family transposase [Candidatus Electrothrix sp. EH2]
MNEITTLLSCLHSLLDRSTYRQLLVVSQSLLAMTGRVTMLGISRWAEQGGSYRTVQRFFAKEICWPLLNPAIIKACFENSSSVVLVAGDATTVTKSGKKTFGLGKFFSSIYSRPVPGVAFQSLSLLNVENRKSWPILTEQILPEPKHEQGKLQKKKKSGRGRPKGSKNTNRRDVKFNTEMTQVQKILRQLLCLVGNTFNLAYFVYDGAFGNNAAVQMALQVGLHLISKLRCDSALYFKWQGVYSGRGARRIYGDKINYKNLPAAYLKSEKTEGCICTRIYQFEARHKKFADTLNVVIINKSNRLTKKSAYAVLFSSSLELGWEDIINYYRLRFQIEFNFRDAKQHWGLEDFMVIEKQPVFNAANLSLWMVNLSHAILEKSEEKSILDLKSRYHGIYYVEKILKILQENTIPINIMQLIQEIPMPGRIHKEEVAP